MKAKFTFLVMLFFLTTSIYALEPVHNKRRKLAGGFLKSKLERTEKSTDNGTFQRKMEFQKQANSIKSAQAIKQRLDSYTYEELEEDGYEKGKSEFIYDANGMLTHEREYYWDEAAAKMVFVSESETTYDVEKKRIQYINTYLDETTNQFVIEYRTTYSYDNNGNIKQTISYYWDTTNNHAAQDKTDYTYDSSKNLIQIIMSYFDESTNQFVFWYKDDYIYNGSGKETQHINYIWDNYFSKQWEPSTKYESTYDSQGNLVVSLESSASNFNNTWIWTPDNKYEYTYDPKGLLTQILEYEMDSNNQWKLDNKDIYIYDDSGNNTQSLYYYNWDLQTSQWDDVYKSEYTYDNRYTFNDLILPWGDDEDSNNYFGHMITEISEYGWNISTKEWILEYEMAFAYSPVNVTAINQLDAELSKVYPNPFSESVSFSIPGSYSEISFELFDLQGRKLFAKAIGNNEKVNMEGFQSGMYLFKLNVDGKVQNGKLVKE
ncbi:MAG: T9SS type A sorting domain-containing protein [Bacteroidota bacterium]|nr:T9SS type A sorting domain-containing protein [Bacteroidota bacterium]